MKSGDYVVYNATPLRSGRLPNMADDRIIFVTEADRTKCIYSPWGGCLVGSAVWIRWFQGGFSNTFTLREPRHSSAAAPSCRAMASSIAAWSSGAEKESHRSSFEPSKQ
jgi:hypothetical protein